jgi:hypothetical protein
LVAAQAVESIEVKDRRSDCDMSNVITGLLMAIYCARIEALFTALTAPARRCCNIALSSSSTPLRSRDVKQKRHRVDWIKIL